MRLAPIPQLSGTTCRMPGGLRAPWYTLKRMRELVRMGRVDPRMIQIATNLVFLQPEKDEFSEVNAIFEWVRDTVRYMRDVHDVEVLSEPFTTVSRQVGDCDDKATLLATLFECAGYPTRFVLAGYSLPNFFDHVYVQVFSEGRWIDADATEPFPLGYSPPDPLTLDLER